MPRIYQKRADARRARITIPVSANLLDWLRKLALSHRIPPTTLAHNLIENGVDEMRKGKPE